jgi:SAM-dependent methyltransferase
MSEKLIPAYRQLAAAGGNFHGLSIVRYKDAIGRLIFQLEAKSILDFGCGRGDAYSAPYKLWKTWGLDWPGVHLYDPSFKEHNVLPPEGKQFDLVICSDVLEHIPEDEVDEFIARLFKYARKGVWASVCTRPAKKQFPDGTNLHCTLHPMDWWYGKFVQQAEAAGCVEFVLVESP